MKEAYCHIHARRGPYQGIPKRGDGETSETRSETMENIFIALVVLVLLALLGGLTMWGILLWRKITARDAARFYPPDAKPVRSRALRARPSQGDRG